MNPDLKNKNIILRQLNQVLKEKPMLLTIGDISNTTGVAQNKIRYWEKCNYIHSVQEKRNQNRRYHLSTLVHVFIINYYLNQGFTLKVATKKAIEFKQYHELISKIISQRFHYSEDENRMCLSVGKIDNHPDQTVNFIMKNGKVHVELKPTQS